MWLFTTALYELRYVAKAAIETQNIIAYNCHGMTVYISPLADLLKNMLIPAMVLFVLLGLVAALMVLLSTADIRIKVEAHIVDKSGGGAIGGGRS